MTRVYFACFVCFVCSVFFVRKMPWTLSSMDILSDATR
jgi:hypothetical protein